MQTNEENPTSPLSGNRIAVAMSGGVDSSVAALMLQRQGHEVHGFFLDNWLEPDQSSCQHIEHDLKMAEAICNQLRIPFRVLNFSQEYWEKVFSVFLDGHLLGMTPNPDILCNQEIKFKALLDTVLEKGYMSLATGHHTRLKVDSESGCYQLLKGHDTQKDQSYFLCQLNQHQLQHSLFPIGHLTKPMVRTLAKQANLPNFAQKDSTGLCFIGERHFQDFLSQYLIAKPGIIINTQKERIGKHNGLMFYTIGQRKGLDIGGLKQGTQAPWYVVDKNLKENELIVAQGLNNPLLFAPALALDSIHWIQGVPPQCPLSCHAKIRYRQHEQSCRLIQDNNQYIVVFDQPQRAITPGQYVVFYDQDICMGGGIIRAALQTSPADQANTSNCSVSTL